MQVKCQQQVVENGFHVHVRKKRKQLISLNIFHMFHYSGKTSATADVKEKNKTKQVPNSYYYDQSHYNWWLGLSSVLQ